MDVKTTIEKRRAYRSLESVSITDEVVDDLAESARLSPSCFNNQPWRFVFIRKKEQLEFVFTALTRGNVWAHKASMIIAVFSNTGYDCNIKERHFYLFDTGMATAYIILRATELGLIAHPIAGFDEQKVKSSLNIPDEDRLITLIIVGKQADAINPNLSEKQVEHESKRPPRKPIEDFRFLDRYEQ